MNVLGIPVRIMELALMELMNTVVPVLLGTLDLTVKQVISSLIRSEYQLLKQLLLKKECCRHLLQSNLFFISKLSMNVLLIHVKMMGHAWMDLMYTPVPVLLDTLDSVVEQVDFIK